MNLSGIAAAANGEMTNKRLQSLYQRDFIAWQADVLGYRTYEKMEAIANDALYGPLNRVAIKSSNGTSKSFTVASMILWTGSVFDVGETVSIISAPSLSQIEKVLFAYMKSGKSRAEERGFYVPGNINESLEWRIPGANGNIDLAFGRKPSPGQEVNTFQGVRSQFGRTYVFFDEGGGLTSKMWTAAEAVLTGGDARLIAIGNPDDVGTEWHRIFTERKYDDIFSRHTLSSYDLPTFTGEVVYPDDPQMEERMLKSLTQVAWVENKKIMWGEKDARFQSKVLGEFPKDGGNGFFPQSALDTSYNTDIDTPEAPLILGCDIARWGADESVIAANWGGRVRIVDDWAKCDLVDSARRIHKYAVENGAVEVRIDSTGVGGGVYDMLDRLEEFSEKSYTLIGWDNGHSSPDLSQWSNKRAYAHDSLRSQMVKGEIDLDIEDELLREEIQLITYKFTNRGGIQITAKDEMKTALGGSPDRLDAVIMASADLSPWTGNEYNHYAPGSVIAVDPADTPDTGLEEYMMGAGMPMLFRGFGNFRRW